MNQSQTEAYTNRLLRLQQSLWKRALDVQAPYRWNLNRLRMGRMLEIGCGIGRNLINLGSGVGIDPNASAVEIACSRGLIAYTPEAFLTSPDYQQASYDSLLLAHVAEHLGVDETISLVARYLNLLKPNGQVVMITPQEAGYRSDPTHVTFIDFVRLREINAALGLEEHRIYSFPFPRIVGKLFRYNEFVFISRRPA
jgi:2-polyprenyl-3-methyl-5-hydroxy-6-metoxy-1,4-benzoquinol methylase